MPVDFSTNSQHTHSMPSITSLEQTIIPADMHVDEYDPCFAIIPWIRATPKSDGHKHRQRRANPKCYYGTRPSTFVDDAPAPISRPDMTGGKTPRHLALEQLLDAIERDWPTARDFEKLFGKQNQAQKTKTNTKTKPDPTSGSYPLRTLLLRKRQRERCVLMPLSLGGTV